MSEEDRPKDPESDETPADLPAAVQWMMQQATAGQSAGAAPLSENAIQWPALAPRTTEAALAARESRINDALRGNDRLTAGLDDDAAETLMTWGIDMARLIVRDTAGLDDTAAEDILQPRVRAVRRLMMAASQAITKTTESAGMSEWLGQAAVALGDRLRQPNMAEMAAFRDRWRLLAGHPTEQIAALQGFVEDHLSRQL